MLMHFAIEIQESLKWHSKEQIPEYIRDTIVSKVEDIRSTKI